MFVYWITNMDRDITNPLSIIDNPYRWGTRRVRRRVRAVAVSSFAPNKANSPRFRPENGGGLQKQSQSRPGLPSPANPKHEMRNPKQIRNPKDSNAKDAGAGQECRLGSLRFGSFELVSSFDSRISCFPPRGGVIIRAKQSQFRRF